MVIMMAKKKFKLKKKFRRYLVVLVVLIALVCFGVNRYNLYKYHQTDEYKLLELGYTKDTVDNITKNLNGKQVTYLVETEKIDYVDDIINEKYFIKKNFNDYLSYYEKNSKKSFTDVVAIVNVGANQTWYENTKTTDYNKGLQILTNKFNLLDNTYDTGEIKKFSSTYAYGEVSASKDCYDAFIEMAKAAKKDGITLVLTSGYRTYDEQESIYNDFLKRRGEEYADAYAARAGASEHQTGLALDIFTNGATTDTFEGTETYTWLIEHCTEYGFILRYPKDKEYLTGYNPESWHYRYVGVETAKKVKAEGITYDEYYAYYLA